jgi:TonB family protein
MHTDQIRGAAHKACRAGVVIAGLQFAAMGLPALAQTTPPATANGPSEALQRQALSPYRFILQNASAPARKAAAPAAPPEPKKAAPVEQAALQPRPSPQAAPPSATPQAAPEAATPVAVFAPKPPEPPPVVHREIIPIKTDEPHLSAALLRERPSGVVKVSFEVHPDGSTAAVKVIASSNRSLNRPSVEAVSGWKFQPVDEVLTVETELDYHYQ